MSKVANVGKQDLTVYGMVYYGFAFQPGLIPIDTPPPNDPYNSRQQEETANGALIVNDIWRLTARRQLQFSGFYRYYTLDVRPNFGDGLIRQSEHRNVTSQDVLYAENYHTAFSLMAGANFRREAPRALNLDRADASNLLEPVTSHNITLNFYSPFVAVDGTLQHFFHYNLRYRRHEVNFDNRHIYSPEFSFSRRAAINSPKGTLSLLFPKATVSLSYGQAFHTNDPRIGTTGISAGTIVSKTRSFKLVATKTIAATEFRLTLAHVTTAQQLARISNDTGLQQDVGPGLSKSVTLTALHNFSHGFLQALFARADARDRETGQPTPEAPRLIWGVLGTMDKLPFHLMSR